jgi:hypothetical protein
MREEKQSVTREQNQVEDKLRIMRFSARLRYSYQPRRFDVLFTAWIRLTLNVSLI